jgi:transcriptional regulator GlxA family with amidase domain
VVCESGLSIDTEPLPAADERIDTVLLAGGWGVFEAMHDAELLAWISAVSTRSRRLATVCTGTFLAAATGLLDGRTVTTHWARAERLQQEFPALTVDPDPIYVRDGNVWTSAGVTAGIDLALAMVEADHGSEIAQTVARWLVMFLHRPGGQTQFAAPVWAPRAERTTVRAVQALVEAAPGGDHRLPAMAAAAAMSVRHFSRVFTSEVGEPPGRYVERVRLEAARRELETTNDTLDVVAARCGFGTAETLRRAFQRRVGVAPDTYRRRFRVVA